jgi:hypothetical protein
MAQWNPIKYKTKKILRQYGDGINAYLPPLDIGESELTDSLNCSDDDYPSIAVRNDRQILELPATSEENALGVRQDTYLHVLDGSHWLYSAITSTAYTQLSSAIPANAKSKFVEFNTEAFRYTILAFSSGSSSVNKAYDGTTTLVALTSNAPHSNLYTAYKFRVFGIDDNKRTLRFSALGSVTDWITSLDAGSIDLTNVPGDVTAITTFNDHICIWTDRSMWELYGNSPTNYEVTQVSNDIGCATNFSYIECKGILYFMDRNGIYSYSGGMPIKISDKVDKWVKNLTNYTNISAGVKGDKIYFSVCYGSSTQNLMLVYDAYKQKWFIEDSNFVHMVNISGKLYAISNTGKIYNLDYGTRTGYDTYSSGGSSAITWAFETKAYNDRELDKAQALTELWVNHEGTTSATMTIGYTTNVNSTTYTDFVATSDFTHSTQPLKEQINIKSTDFENAEVYKLKFSGTGYKKIHGVQLNNISYGGGGR